MNAMKLYKKLDSNYTVVSNNILNSKLSLKAIGLYLYMVSKPDDWEFSVRGMAAQLKDGESSVRSALAELENALFLHRERVRDEKGKLGDIQYHITDRPLEKPNVENPTQENPIVENQRQVSTKEVNTIELSTKNNGVVEKQTILTANDAQYFQELSDKFDVPISFVASKYDDLANYCKASGRKYKDYKAALYNFVKKDALAIRNRMSDVTRKAGIDAQHLG